MYEEQDVMESYVESSPRPFGEIPGLWLQIFQMTEDFFRREAPRVSGSNTVIGVLIMGAISAIISMVVSVVGGGIMMMMVPAEMRGSAATAAGGSMVSNLICSVILFPMMSLVAFYLGNGVLYVLARIFGGKGDFGQQAYLQSLYAVPIGIVTGALSLLSVIPGVGGFLSGLASLVVGAYSFVLTVRVLKVVHDMTTGRAVAALLVPVIILVLIPCVMIMMLLLMGPSIGNVFSNIVIGI